MPLIQIRNLSKRFPIRSGIFSARESLRAVDDVSFTIGRGEVFGLVGESGSGKSTIGKLLMRFEEPSGGSIVFDGTDLGSLSKSGLRAIRKRMQMVFQDSASSLNPHLRIGKMLEEALLLHCLERGASGRRERIQALLASVGLPAVAVDNFPHEFSGGQRQRLGIARALSVEPDFIVADEAVSALDVSTQAQIINLLIELKSKLGLTVLFISHNLAVVQNIADTVAVMYLGRLMEIAPTRQLFERPQHPYTAALISAVPVPDPSVQRQRIILSGEIPSPITPPSGCPFRTRCPYAIAVCAEAVPQLRAVGPEHQIACIRDDLQPGLPATGVRNA